MSISKSELISNIKDKISQFKSNFSKNKQLNQESSNLNFEINRDTLKLFYKNKNKQNNIEEQVQDNNKINLNTIKPNSTNSIIQKKDIKEGNLKMKEIEKDEKNNNKYKYDIKNRINNDINKIQNNKLNNEDINNNNIFNNYIKNNNNININNNFYIDQSTKVKKMNNIGDVNKIVDKEKAQDNSLGYIKSNNFNDLNFQDIKNNRKIIKREKSAPKISVDGILENPLTDKNKNNNIKNNTIRNSSNNNTINNNNIFKNNSNVCRTNNNTEDKMQKLLQDFNINLENNIFSKRKIPYLNYDINKNIDNNMNINMNINKALPQKNKNSLNSLYELSGNINLNKIQKDNYLKNFSSIDYLNVNFKKNDDRYNQSLFKTKMSLLYKEIDNYNKPNLNKKPVQKKYFSNYGNLNNNYNFSNDYNSKIDLNTINTNTINNRNIDIFKLNSNLNEQIIKDKDNNNNNKIFENKNSYNEIYNFKKYLQNLSKEKMSNLPPDVQSELKDIFNILYQKLNE